MQLDRAGGAEESRNDAVNCVRLTAAASLIRYDFFTATITNHICDKKFKQNKITKMERMWRKVNRGFAANSGTSAAGTAAAAANGESSASGPSRGRSGAKKVPQSNTGTVSSAGGFGEVQNVAAVAANQRDFTQEPCAEMIGIEKRRRRRRKSRPRRSG